MDTFLTYIGDVRAILGIEHVLAFTTVHPEGLPTAVYFIDTNSQQMQAQALPCGGVALAKAGNDVYVAGTDRRIYVLQKNKAPKPLTDAFEFAIAALSVVSQDRLAVVTGKKLALVSLGDGSVSQMLSLPETGTCIGADKTGSWVAVGCEKGHVAVFDGQEKAEFELSESDKLHEGSVTAILFEPEELRFFSTGADNKLLSTFARGRLEPEDKGRANNHEAPVTAMIATPVGDRIITGSSDKILKNWPRAGAVKPAMQSDKIGALATVALGAVQRDGRWDLVVVCQDNRLCMIPLQEEDGRFDDDSLDVRLAFFRGALDWAKNEFAQTWDTKRREKAMKQLAEWNDTASLELLAKRIEQDQDAATRVSAAKILGLVTNPRVATLLEPFLSAKDGAIRTQVFKGLQHQLGAGSYRPIDAALKTEQPEIGVLAVKALTPLANSDDQGLARLTACINAKSWDVRKQTLVELEHVYPDGSPQASLTALLSTQADLRSLALRRLFERKMLDKPEVLSAIRRKLEDDDATVRSTAFRLSLIARPNLANGVRSVDEEWHRQLTELEGGKDTKPPTVPNNWRESLEPADLDTLLQATASRALDTCLRGAKGLALLKDARAFPLLLQLSREEQEFARVEVCRALGALGDPRAVKRLQSMLLDSQASVRDAAYTAVERLYANEPLKAAEAGLTATHEDVRLRGLQTLLFGVKRNKPKPGDAAWNLFVRALNDGAPSVRREAFKSAVNQQIGGGGEATLRFALQSIHADVRREVLTELQAQQAEAWATPLLYEFFNDPAPELRNEAFDIATKKNKELVPIEAALQSKYPNTRIAALDALFKKHSQTAQAIIVKAIADTDVSVRKKAMDSLVEDEATEAIMQAACALARMGEAVALPVLSQLAFAPEPTDKQKVSEWLDLANQALTGLYYLQDTSVFENLLRLLESPHQKLARHAATTLTNCTPAAQLDTIRKHINHADADIRFWLLQTLANHGDDTVHPLLFSADLDKVSPPQFRLQAVAALGPTGAGRLVVFLDSEVDIIRREALLLHLLMEYAGTDGTPDLLLQALSAQAPRVRLTAAQGLEAFHDRTAFEVFVLATLNDRGEEAAWKLGVDVAQDLAAALTFGEPLLRVHACNLLQYFEKKDSAAFTQALGVFRKRNAAALAAAKAKWNPTPSALSQAELRQLAFGAYVGLTREQGSSTATPAVIRVRQTALNRIYAIASTEKTYARDAQPILAQSLSDANQAVRVQAFEHLQNLGMPQAVLGAEALEAGYTDLGVKGLELLSGGTKGEGDAVLERVLLSRTDDLAIEAAKLLAKTRSKVAVAAVALDAVHEPMRTQAVNWLAEEYSESADAQAALRKAVTSRYRKVREQSAFALARKKDPAAFDTLCSLLKDATEGGTQYQITQAFNTLGDKRAAAVMLERIEHDPTGTANRDLLLRTAAEFRVPETVTKFATLAETFSAKNAKADALHAVEGLCIVSGFDQVAPDPEEENAYAKAEKEQHPRHPGILATVFELSIKLDLIYSFLSYVTQAKGARGSEVDPVLATFATHTEPDVREKAIEVIAWRARKRNGPAEPLVKALKHKDQTMQFLAAEGLAKAGRNEGMQILLSSLEYLEDVELRQRAVLALGELAEPRTVDTLLKLASENGHALQEAAAEAIGHLRNSPKGDEVGKLLEKLAKAPMAWVMQRALVGLRWFDSPEGWQIIRGKLKDSYWRTRLVAAQQLKYDSDPATRTLLLEVLRKESDHDVASAAFDSLTKLLGPDSLEPHYTAIQNESISSGSIGSEQINPLDVITKKGDALRLLELFPKCSQDVQEALEASLIGRETIPAKEATAALTHADAATVRLAARLLGRVPKPTSEMKQAAADAVKKWWKLWVDQREQLERGQITEDMLHTTTDCLRILLWTDVQLGSTGEHLAGLALARPDDLLAKPLRLEAMRNLARAENISEVVLKAFDTLAHDPDAEVRTFAASVLAKADAKRSAKLMPSYLTDRPTLSRVQAVGGPIGEDVSAAVAQPHQQSVALPVLIAKQDVSTLATVAKNRKAPEPVRLGAVEGLGFMANENAEKVLAEIGSAAGDDEDVRKAAWRALSRSKRKRKKAGTA